VIALRPLLEDEYEAWDAAHVLSAQDRDPQ